MTCGVFVKCQSKGQALKIAEWILQGTSDEKPQVSIIETEEWVLRTPDEYRKNEFNIKKRGVKNEKIS